ncbi:SMP-30/gluconolactonase/LRE family protein [Novosphingobium lindaniclasticum]|uniref:SMP-30/Gluconolactonase/LRE-like region domain-containing protein n=1 Tax=Novosphingobium lindaniclasticum LE124 TaxID=1096930 RepID=T0H4T7_9SPHN|nr:SMP-30/gluconolactonase/LRE family protein [Novosphingobium lindaniclasticum]EQB07987.1 hypothetical protein L284_21945 [Novosphingobium lindaniclasticum LE124]
MPGGADVTPESVLSLGATLGEGPVWTGDRLWFVDIKEHRLYRHDPATGMLDMWHAPDQIGWALPTERGDMIAGVKTGLHRFSPETGAFTPLHDPEPTRPGNRLNDAATDPSGRIWLGSMHDEETEASGALYRLDRGHCVHAGLPEVVITNGPAISADGRTLWHTDTLGKTIWRVSVDEDGTLGKPEAFVTIEDGAGYPDGAVIDAEGCLWTGLFGGWGVRRYDPAGKLMVTVKFPVANITKIAFGGPGLCTAYATTARKGLSAAELEQQPLAGDVFAFDAGVSGLPVHAANS